MTYQPIFIFFVYFVFGMMNAQKTNLAPSKSITEDYFGTKIIDEFRNLENLKDPSVINWMQSQTNYSDSVLYKIPNREYYINKRIEFDQRQSFSVDKINITENNFCFYLKKKPDENTAKLYYRKGFKGIETEIFNPENYNLKSRKKYLINYIKPNYDGSKVVIALTESGKEISEMVIYDLKSNKILPDLITNCWPTNGGGISWLPDNNSFVYLQFPITDPNSNLFMKNMQAVVYKIGQNPKELNVILSKKNNPNLKINSEDYPIVKLPTKESQYLFGYRAGATNFNDTYFTPVSLINEKYQWKLLFPKEEKINGFIVENDSIIYISEKNGINAVYCTSLKNPDFKNSNILIPSIPNEVINGLYQIKTGFVFSSSRNGVEAKLYLYQNSKIENLILPFPSGDITVTTQNNYSDNFWINCTGWKNNDEYFRFDQLTKKFIPENLAPVVEYPEFKDIIVKEITVKSHDGQDIPLSILCRKDIQKDKNNPLLIDAYGAYGINNSPFLDMTFMLWALKGGIVAIAHVRGGAEKGESWHLGGFKDTKPNSWKDLISCAEYMIHENYTSKDKIAIWGQSAGGITIGRAMTERPDLFKVAIITAGILNTLRIEAMPNGLNSVKEFGSKDIESEFKALYEMDAYQHIKKSIKYPATFITTGINDPRVAPWMPVKFAAKLQMDNISDNTILLKVDYKGGHGGRDQLLKQKYSNLADVFSFAFWQLGHPDYQPKENIKK
ncbi:prolyl oligopeptidase family serine peptidase [Chryseobacterium sp. YR221]|uniref:prolyl oligopeptidase family serine peptidase n=1 Tax=Chryseobacterium sp. YR221 TaxID=1500293 RepID=UPI0009D8809C|nr:prolyl oligopeptidase family serine peptidase [Chryseobacterium sp. YR221]SMC31352.1 prolyl oligopeptidase [Chryseobacterium sp. YR221]